MTSLASHPPPPPPAPDAELLERFVCKGAEPAFREIVERHAGLVLSVARRQLGDEEAARDVAQRVFALLARKAPLLRGHPSITGWLFTACRLECRAGRRQEIRRARLMQDYARHREIMQEGSGFSARLLDEALEQLPDADREVLLVRYYDGGSFADIATARKITEPAARKQVSRAMERLAAVLGARGQTLTPAALCPAMASAYTPAPALPPPGMEALVADALRSMPLLRAAAWPLFMTAKAPLITGAALVWIACVAGGWQAGVYSSAAEAASFVPTPVTTVPEPSLKPPLPGQGGSAAVGKRAEALRDLIARIAEDLDAAQWDNAAKIRADARLASLSDDDAAEALTVVMQLSDPPAALISALWVRRGRSEGLEALKAMESLPPSQVHGARLDALRGWANTAPLEALRWMQARAEPLPEGLAGIFTAWAAKDPAAALTAAAALTDPGQRVSALAVWCRSSTDSTHRSELMNAILTAPEASRAALLQAAAVQWRENPAAYAAWLSGHQALEKYGTLPVEALCSTWAESEPSAAADWLRQNLAAKPSYPRLLEKIVSPWAMVDAPGASEWLAAQPAGPEMDPSIVSLISMLPPNEGPAIAAWADRLHDRSLAASILRDRQLKSSSSFK